LPNGSIQHVFCMLGSVSSFPATLCQSTMNDQERARLVLGDDGE